MTMNYAQADPLRVAAMRQRLCKMCAMRVKGEDGKEKCGPGRKAFPFGGPDNCDWWIPRGSRGDK